ncbi:restriction endonuclease subunit S [Nodularia sphaerocarpa]|uniref:restriction endonuclease subunit S n=1 Tax=Nodularia sphaerocarpa TaxID=137816 RepID=UPI001EFA620B|nr:restriction endonuclease subunit S [Nodularia sphaerocarpa]MDB9375203.1 restriction endonuclease subunit S [Nodularia sphaerocarpa CS-585]MDB9378681.1 restriction endonuclease subunit S [Nodularia sphaerocarpa CS-585A2]ULP71473.1 hypothetical protein BDGGKGIB_01100 [Nodularia sphaerocarpa UHCC 0038]
MSDWKRQTFKEAPIEIIDGDRGTNYPTKEEFQNYGYCLFLNTGNVTKNGFYFNSTDFISQEKDSQLRKGKAKLKDIILTTRGTVGNVAYFNESIPYKNIRINSGMVILRADESKIYPYYLYLYLRSSVFKKQILKNTSGSAQPQLPIGNLHNVIIPYPEISTQKKIASVLSSLDDKIELNNRINAELENLAKTIYDYWFVQFDFPDENGKPYKSSGGKMVYNQELKREIPAGWEVKKLSYFCDKIGDGIHGTPKYVDISDYSFINGNNLNNGFIVIDNDTKKVSLDEYKKYFIELNGETILLSINGTLGNLAIYTGEKVMLGKSAAYINCKRKYRPYCYQFLKLEHTQKQLWNVATGSTIKNLSLESLKSILILFPGEDLIKRYYELTKPLDYKRINIFKQNQQLTQLRDWLLPMLMNGQITVK